MIQRIQSIFYLMAAICASIVFLKPLASSDQSATPYLEDKLFDVQDNTILLVVAALAVILPLVSIFLFKNRSVQKRIGYLSIIFSLLVIVAASLLFLNAGSTLDKSVEMSDEMGLYFPVGAIVFSMIANYFVSKDDKLVSSMDRLR